MFEQSFRDKMTVPEIKEKIAINNSAHLETYF